MCLDTEVIPVWVVLRSHIWGLAPFIQRDDKYVNSLLTRWIRKTSLWSYLREV